MRTHMRIVCVSGHSKTGKTLLIEKLIQELRSRGYVVAAVKHACTKPELDREGKDSWRFWKAGANTAVISQNMSAIILKKSLKLEELVKFFENFADIIIAEGFKKSNFRKIVILDENTNLDEFCGEIIEILNKEDVITGKVNVKNLVDKILEPFLS